MKWNGIRGPAHIFLVYLTWLVFKGDVLFSLVVFELPRGMRLAKKKFTASVIPCNGKHFCVHIQSEMKRKGIGQDT